MAGAPEPSLEDVLEKAADLQRVVPGAVLVGGAAAAFYARHRVSMDHDHILVDLDRTFDTVLENLEALGDFSLAKARAGKLILGELGGIETGVRQMLRRRPLETTTVDIRGKPLEVPTAAEVLRIKAWLAVSRNQVRDYLDIAALADTIGIAEAAGILGADRRLLRRPESSTRSGRHPGGPSARRSPPEGRRGHPPVAGLQAPRSPLARLGRRHPGPGRCRGGDDPVTQFRNVSVDIAAPVEQWPHEAIETLLDRGSLSDWRRLARRIRDDPWGPVARSVEAIAEWDEHYGVDHLMRPRDRPRPLRCRCPWPCSLCGTNPEGTGVDRPVATRPGPPRRDLRLPPVGLRERQGGADHRRPRPDRTGHRADRGSQPTSPPRLRRRPCL